MERVHRSQMAGWRCAALIVVAACTTARLPYPPSATNVESRADWSSLPGSMSSLTRAELLAADVLSAEQAVQRLRPRFLLGQIRRPLAGPVEIAVYLDGLYAGDTSVLSLLPVDVVES